MGAEDQDKAGEMLGLLAALEAAGAYDPATNTWKPVISGISIFPYAGDPNTHVTSLRIGDLCVDYTNGVLYIARAVGTAWVKTSKPLVVPAIAGALSTVADAPAKAVLTSIIAALVADGFATDATT